MTDTHIDVLIDDFTDWMLDLDRTLATVRHRRRVLRALLSEYRTFDLPSREVAAWLRRHNGWTRYSYYAALTVAYEGGPLVAESGLMTGRTTTPVAEGQSFSVALTDKS